MSLQRCHSIFVRIVTLFKLWALFFFTAEVTYTSKHHCFLQPNSMTIKGKWLVLPFCEKPRWLDACLLWQIKKCKVLTRVFLCMFCAHWWSPVPKYVYQMVMNPQKRIKTKTSLFPFRRKGDPQYPSETEDGWKLSNRKYIYFPVC